jgi:hypothetical protein
MIIYAVYIITEGGGLMFSQTFQTQKDSKDSDLVSGLLTALRMFANEITKSDVKTFEVEGLTYHFQSFDFFSVVLVTSSAESPQEYLHQLGLRFMKKYGEVFLSGGKSIDSSQFENFKKDVDDILGEIVDVSSSINPTKKLSTAEIFSLPRVTQKVALALLQLEEGSVDEIAMETNLDTANVQLILDKLIEIGFIGQKTRNQKNFYFCTL